MRVIAQRHGKDLIVHLSQEPDKDHLETVNGQSDQVWVDLTFADPRQARPQQRRLFFALLNDIATYYVVPPDFLKTMFYTQYEFYTAGKSISLSDTTKSSVSDANQLLDLVIDFMFEWHVPFKKGYELLPKDEAYYQYECCRHRVCAICGREHADIHHWDAVGTETRKLADHRQHRFMALCRTCHNEFHQIGSIEFAQKYHVQPVKLDKKTLIKLGVMTRKRMDEIDQRNLETGKKL
ncbi:hypothetical protein GKC44_11905 [Lactobacillus parabuchneri]|uniref:Uncharacterized protein n=1 Tax=Lentilactobacillus parabuchneri TaxID=152331 RepID=A0A844EFL3_9LACO|nr:hypothetical protein [Lentilactobacillus parabuchneri]